jgi:DNA topoisomerase IB
MTYHRGIENNSEVPAHIRALSVEAQDVYRFAYNAACAERLSLKEAYDAAMDSVKMLTLLRKYAPDQSDTLYVHRPLIDSQPLLDWAKSQGFKTTLPASDMHVTVCFSKQSLQWPDPSHDTVTCTVGERLVKRLGEAVVLAFESPQLQSDHQRFMDAGASFDYDQYTPHITITYDPDIDITDVVPYEGTLAFGPEVFAPIKEDWGDDIEEVAVKYSPDQAREPAGKPEGGRFRSQAGGSMRVADPEEYEELLKRFQVWHGTSDEAINEILSEGLIPGWGRGADVHMEEEWPSLFEAMIRESEKDGVLESRQGSIYVSSDPKVAENFAEFARKSNPGSKAVILQIGLPDEAMAGLKPDEQASAMMSAFRHEGKIPPEWITQYKVMSEVVIPKEHRVAVNTTQGFGRNPKAKKAKDLKFYVVIVTDEKAKKYSPDQPREPAGTAEGGRFASAESALHQLADSSLPPDDDQYQYFYHSFRWMGDADAVESEGLSAPGKRVFLSKDEIRDRGAGFAIVRVPTGKAEEGRDVVEAGLSYREFRVDAIPAQDIVRIVRAVPTGGGHTIREDRLAARALRHPDDPNATDLPEKYRAWFNKYDPDQPRAPEGTTEGGRWVRTAASGDREELEAAGKEVPEHIAKLKVPPGWTDVFVNPDPDGELMVVGKDAKGRLQYVYSEAFTEGQMRAKFARIQEMDKTFGDMGKQVKSDQASSDLATREHADVTALIMQTGIRPGSMRDRGGAKTAYGATTLLGQHVKEDGMRLEFTGKKGVSLSIPVEDKGVGKMLRTRAREAGPDGRLFPKTTEKSLRDYVDGLGGGSFSPKDFRTYTGTSMARDLISEMTPPSSFADYKKLVRSVAKSVSTKLGNTPVIALQSYIDPHVFANWRSALAIKQMDYDVWFGAIEDDDYDWRKDKPVRDPDDTELVHTSYDVVTVLGFDPQDLE